MQVITAVRHKTESEQQNKLFYLPVLCGRLYSNLAYILEMEWIK